MEGEQSGKKKSSEQVAQLIRNELDIEEYVTSRQIKSLYSRWSKLLRQGKLTDPAENSDTNDYDNQIDEEDEDDEHENIIQDVLRDVMTDLT